MTKNSTVDQLIPLDGRFKAKPSVEELAERYRGQATNVAASIELWVEHFGGDLSPAQKHLLGELAHVSLLREALLSELAKNGVTDSSGKASSLVAPTRMLIETGLKLVRELTAPGSKEEGSGAGSVVDVAELWKAALATSPADIEQKPENAVSTDEPADWDGGTGQVGQAERNSQNDSNSTPGSDDSRGGAE